ncbi:hypothetical protein HpCK30_10660 [Helicobacter pylori]
MKLDKKEIESRNTIEKDTGECELLILSDKISVTPFKSGELEWCIILMKKLGTF